jgi:hypothetical protein
MTKIIIAHFLKMGHLLKKGGKSVRLLYPHCIGPVQYGFGLIIAPKSQKGSWMHVES